MKKGEERGREGSQLVPPDAAVVVPGGGKLRLSRIGMGDRRCCAVINTSDGIPIVRSISGLVVEYIVAIDVTRVRFPADAYEILYPPQKERKQSQ